MRLPEKRQQRTVEGLLQEGVGSKDQSLGPHENRDTEEIFVFDQDRGGCPPTLERQAVSCTRRANAEELERSFETKAHSEKSMTLSDMTVSDEDGYLIRSMTIQNRVAKVEVETNARSRTYSRSSRLHVQDVTNVKRGGEWVDMESKNLSDSLKVNEFY